MDERIARRLVAEHPGHYQNVVKAKSYRGIEQDTIIVGWTGAIFTHSAANEQVIYDFMKTLFEHKEEYYQIHRDARALTLQDAMYSISMPFHPGAVRYLKEMGVMK